MRAYNRELTLPLKSVASVLALAICNLAAAPSVGIPIAIPNTIPVNTSTTVMVTCQINNSTPLPAGVNLLRLDPAGIAAPTVVGVMHDDGKNGDAVAGDGAFTLSASMTQTATGPIQLQVSAAFRGAVSRVRSGVIMIGAGTGTQPTITDFNPKSGPIGTSVTVIGSNFGSAAQMSMTKQGGGTIGQPLSSASPTAVTFVIVAGTATGPITLNNGSASVNTSSAFTVSPSNTFSLTASPAAANLIKGQTVACAVRLTSSNNFNQLAALSITGTPSGVIATFTPPSITAGQTAVLTLMAPANQPVSTANLSITASATVDGIAVSQSSPISLAIVAPTTTLMGRTVVSDPLETPLAGVTVTTLGLDGNDNTTGCTGHTAVADAAGNFALTNLPLACTGPQLVAFDGTTATAPAGKYAGVNLVFTLASGQVTASPVLVHLPRIDTVETFLVTQNSGSVQSHSFTSIPGLSVTVYPGTTFTMPDGTRPNPFPLAAVQVPVDRLPDAKPNVPTMVRVFIVAFQPANASASQPVAVTFPNVSNTAPGTNMVLMTLDPTHGTMVPYGTGSVSANGTQVVPDPDPSHPGHLYGLVHFDWHGQMPPPANSNDPGGGGGCNQNGCAGVAGGGGNSGSGGCSGGAGGGGGGDPCNQGGQPSGGEPVDLASGIHVMTTTDLSIQGGRGSISIQRVYRSMTTNDGPFGMGSQLQYSWQLDAASPNGAAAIKLISPDGNRFLFSRQQDNTLRNSSTPWLQGAVMTTNANGQTSLRFYDGILYQFQSIAGLSVLTSITDRNGNTTTFTQVPLSGAAVRITKITDAAGRSFDLAYDSQAHVTSVTDIIGRTVAYTYNSAGTLATVTDPAGGITQFHYDSQNRIVNMTDARGVIMFQDSYDSNGRVSQQVLPDGGTVKFSYVLANPLAAASPVIATILTDALGNQTTYRFNIQGYVTDVTDALGQSKSFIRDPGTNQLLQMTGPVQCAVCGPLGNGPVSYTYDNQGNRLTSVDALGNTTRYTYDPVFNQVTSITDPLNHTRTFAYDSRGNLTGVTDENGHTSTYTYDPNGLLIRAADALGNAATVEYDGFANPVSITDALGNVTTNVFDSISRRVITADPLGRRTVTGYDALNRIVSVRDGRGSTTQFSYDAVGNLLALTDPRGNSTTYTYDSLSRLKTRVSPLGKSESYEYDLNGNATQFTDRRGQISHFQYDVLNRLISESYQDGATVTRTFDPYSRLLTVNDSASGLFGFQYDAAGRLTSQSGPTGSIVYTRDALGRVATRQVAGQSAVTYAYDPAGNLLGASMPNAGITYSYDARNLPASVSRTNGVTSNYGYDPLGRVLSLIHSKGATVLNTQSYTYDSSSNRVTANNDISQPLVTQATAATVDRANELLTNGGTAYTYDANGNRLTETGPNGSFTYQWDGRNRLASITDGAGNKTALHYDFARNLLRIDSASTASRGFVIDSLTNVASLTDGAGLPVSVLTGRSIDSHYASVDAAGNVSFGLVDLLNSTVGIADASGSVSSKLSYEPYGQATGVIPSAYPFQFTGRTVVFGNIIYERNRFYDALAGRFLSEDPIGVLGGTANISAYVGNNPAVKRDPTGLGFGSFVLRVAKAQYEAVVESLAEDAPFMLTSFGARAAGYNTTADLINAAQAGFGFGAGVYDALAVGEFLLVGAFAPELGLAYAAVGGIWVGYELGKSTADLIEAWEKARQKSKRPCG